MTHDTIFVLFLIFIIVFLCIRIFIKETSFMKNKQAYTKDIICPACRGEKQSVGICACCQGNGRITIIYFEDGKQEFDRGN